MLALLFVIIPGDASSERTVNPETAPAIWPLNPAAGQSEVVRASDSGTLYVATDSGEIYKSTDQGGEWEAVNRGLPGPFYRRTYPPRLVVRPGPIEVLYAVVGYPVHSGLIENRLYRSLDGAAHWQQVKRLPDNWLFDSVRVESDASGQFALQSDHGQLRVEDWRDTSDAFSLAASNGEPVEMPWPSPAASSAAQQPDFDQGNLAILHDDGTFLQEFDLPNRTVQFTPNGFGGYDVASIGFSFESNLGNRQTLGDDDSRQLNLPFFFPFFGVSRNVMFVNANGNVTFDAGDGNPVPSITEFVSGSPRIAPLWDDFNPAATSGSNGVFVRSLGSRVIITWNNVPEFNTTNSSTVQLVLFNDGRIRVSYRSVATKDGLVGISNGSSSSFFRVNFDQDLPASFTTPAPIAEFFNRGLNSRAVAQRFYQSHADSFDFLVVFGSSTFHESLAGGDNLSVTELVKNDISGIGLSNFNDTSAFGSAGWLQSVAVMNRLSDFPDDVNEQIGSSTLSTLAAVGQAVGQRWAAYVRFNDGGLLSDELLGLGLSHWSFFHDTDASFLGGNNWQDLGGGSFRSDDATSRYSPLDQYLMGLRSQGEVPSFFFISNPSNKGAPDRNDAPLIGATVNGFRRNVSINQIIQAEGSRIPSAGSAPTSFRQAFVLIVPQGQEAVAADLNKLENIRQEWETAFRSATDNRGSVNTELVMAGPDLMVQGLTVNPSTVNPGGTVSLSFSIVNQGNQNAGSAFHEIRLSNDNIIDSGDTLLTTVFTSTLAPNQSSSFNNLIVAIPSNTQAGTRFIGVLADSSNQVVESNEGNNTAAAAITVSSPLPDLVVNNLTVNPGSVNPGGTVTVSFSIVNQGGTSANSTTHEIRLSADSTIDGGDVLLITLGTASLPAGGSQSFNQVVTIPSSTPGGNQFIGVRADSASSVTESNEGNNTAAAAITVSSPLPDLVVNNLTVNPGSVNPGGTVTVSFSIVNQGGTSANSTTHQIFLSDDNNITPSDTLLSTVGTPSLSPGASSPFNIAVTIPSSTGSGTRFIGVIADTPNSVSESNENNNTASAPITISSTQPDLVVIGLSVTPTSVAAGGSATVNFTILNQGAATANPASHHIRLSPDSFIDITDTFLNVGTTSVLGPGSSASLSLNVTIPSSTPPSVMFIGIIADANNNVAESNEANNTAGTPITITGAAQPDLVVEGLSVAPTSADAGDAVTVSFTIRNQGSAAAGSASHEIRFSGDMTINGSDTLLTTVSTGSLAAGASTPFSQSVTIPTSAAAGSQFIGLIADSGNAVAESNESNNTASTAVTITSFNEVEPNNNPFTADSITPDVTVIGAIGSPGDVDFFRFSISAFQTVIIDIDAESLTPSSPLDSVVTLFDSTGIIQLGENDDENPGTRDSRLMFTTLLGGELVFRISDFNGNGGSAFKYKARVTIP